MLKPSQGYGVSKVFVPAGQQRKYSIPYGVVPLLPKEAWPLLPDQVQSPEKV